MRFFRKKWTNPLVRAILKLREGVSEDDLGANNKREAS